MMNLKTIPRSIGAVLIAASALVWLASSGAKADTTTNSSQTTQTVQPTIKFYAQNYSGWLYRCETVDQSGQKQEKLCQVLQTISVQQNGHMLPLAQLSFTEAQNRAGYNFSAAVPLGILLPPGVSFAADQNPPLNQPVAFCRSSNCTIVPSLQNDLVRDFRRGTQGHIGLTAENGRKIVINFPLKGFSDAIDALDSGKLPPEVKPAASPTH